MRSCVFIALLTSVLFACGGSDGGDDSTTVTHNTGDTGDEAPPPDDGPDEGTGGLIDEGPGEDEGDPCFPVSRCHSFANQDCAPIGADGAIEGEQFSGGRIREACPGERGIAVSVGACFDYVEISEGCPRRMPDLREPAWPCGRNDDGTCGVQM